MIYYHPKENGSGHPMTRYDQVAKCRPGLLGANAHKTVASVFGALGCPGALGAGEILVKSCGGFFLTKNGC
jgi:hypothetical protein